jgi:two-component sensor histidine kinase
VARQTSGHESPRDFADRFVERLQGLAASHDLLLRNSWEGVDLAELIKSQLSHFSELVETRIILEGPDVWLNPAAAQTLGMALHELATNAAKYGSLSDQNGKVNITWTIDLARPNGRFRFQWDESGGPPAVAPRRSGFGTLLLTKITEQSIQGSVTREFSARGHRWTLDAPTDHVVPMPDTE